MLPLEFEFADFRKELLRPDTEIQVRGHEKAELTGEVEVVLIERGGGEEDALAAVLLDVVSHRFVDLTFAIAEIVAFVEDDEAVATEFGEL